MIRRFAACAVVVAAAFGLASCGAIDQKQLEKTISDKASPALGQTSNVKCPGNLKAKVGETMKCTFTAGGKDFSATLKVTSAKGGKAGYTIAWQPK